MKNAEPEAFDSNCEPQNQNQEIDVEHDTTTEQTVTPDLTEQQRVTGSWIEVWVRIMEVVQDKRVTPSARVLGAVIIGNDLDDWTVGAKILDIPTATAWGLVRELVDAGHLVVTP